MHTGPAALQRPSVSVYGYQDSETAGCPAALQQQQSDGSGATEQCRRAQSPCGGMQYMFVNTGCAATALPG